MNTRDKLQQKEVIDTVLMNFYSVYNELGYGFSKVVYQNALYYALVDDGLKCEKEKLIKVYYNERLVGDYCVDLLVDDRIILKIETTEIDDIQQEIRLMNCLRATDIKIGYVLNFGVKAKYTRKENLNKRR